MTQNYYWDDEKFPYTKQNYTQDEYNQMILELKEQGGGGSELPEVTEDDNGKVLQVNNGEWDKGTVSGLPVAQFPNSIVMTSWVDNEWVAYPFVIDLTQETLQVPVRDIIERPYFVLYDESKLPVPLLSCELDDESIWILSFIIPDPASELDFNYCSVEVNETTLAISEMDVVGTLSFTPVSNS